MRRGFLWGSISIVSLAWLLTACGSGAVASPTPERVPATRLPTSVATVPPPTLLPSTEAAGSYVNPVFDHDFPDPDVLAVGEDYYAYATNSAGIHVQVLRSPDLVAWEALGEGLPDLPGWAVQDFGWTWAPEVMPDPDGAGYIMYYTTRFAIGMDGRQCIGLATADEPQGPFVSPSAEPLICQVDEGGSIDAASFEDEDGQRYLLWKNDGNSGGGITYIYIQELAPDSLALVGEPTRLINADQRWEGVLVEGPTLWKRNGIYHLFYSANDYASRFYAVGHASAQDILGPYEKTPGPFLSTVLPAGIVGPGGQDVALDDQGQTWMVFHSWDPEAFRNLNLVRLDWEGETPVLGPLSRDPLPGPLD